MDGNETPSLTDDSASTHADHFPLRSSRFLSLSGLRDRLKEQASKGVRPGRAKTKIVRKRGGSAGEGGGVGRKGIACRQSQTF